MDSLSPLYPSSQAQRQYTAQTDGGAFKCKKEKAETGRSASRKSGSERIKDADPSFSAD
ncbi:hypothetical protein SD77_3858 [Bacillus badius]|uniref:Uncharacterized protein n=1 Tax=Bacillus badius TaxID=1455 RepID=A0ABR5AWG6_BACBA|nr:hypothetical protein SD77_3858 [Bacillus badius]